MGRRQGADQDGTNGETTTGVEFQFGSWVCSERAWCSRSTIFLREATCEATEWFAWPDRKIRRDRTVGVRGECPGVGAGGKRAGGTGRRSDDGGGSGTSAGSARIALRGG